MGAGYNVTRTEHAQAILDGKRPVVRNVEVLRPVPGSPYTPDDPVRDPRRIEEFVNLVPRSFRVMGLFLQPLVEKVGRERFEAMRWDLEEPPRRQRYLPFRDYPQSDHDRLLAVLSRAEYPTLPEAEAVRRLARHDMELFTGSTFGKVILTMVGDARSALEHVPTVYAKVAPGTKVTVGHDGPVIWLDFAPLYGLWGYQLGQVEGIVGYFGARTSVEVEEDPEEHRVRLRVTLTEGG